MQTMVVGASSRESDGSFRKSERLSTFFQEQALRARESLLLSPSRPLPELSGLFAFLLLLAVQILHHALKALRFFS